MASKEDIIEIKISRENIISILNANGVLIDEDLLKPVYRNYQDRTQKALILLWRLNRINDKLKLPRVDIHGK